MRFQHLSWFFLLVFSLCGANGYATSVRPLELEELVRLSHQIFVGRVISIQQGILPDINLGYTEYTIAVTDWVKGGAAPTVKIRQVSRRGGGLFVPGLPSYKKGEELLLFVHQASEIGLTSPVGMQQGYYHIERTPNGGRFVRAGSMMPSIIRLSSQSRNAASRPAGEAQTADRVPLEEFVSLVRQIH